LFSTMLSGTKTRTTDNHQAMVDFQTFQCERIYLYSTATVHT
jgi:hypothetical protein